MLLRVLVWEKILSVRESDHLCSMVQLEIRRHIFFENFSLTKMIPTVPFVSVPHSCNAHG